MGVGLLMVFPPTPPDAGRLEKMTVTELECIETDGGIKRTLYDMQFRAFVQLKLSR